MSKYLLGKHIHICTTDDQVVVLDLKNDAYFALGAAQMQTLAVTVPGWPSCEGLHAMADIADSAQAATSETLRDLLKEGLIVTDPRSGKDATLVEIAHAGRTLIDTVLVHTLLEDEASARPRIRVADIVYFLAANVLAALLFRFASIETIVGHIIAQRRKRNSRDDSRSFDLDSMRDRVHVFRLLRPFAFTSRDKCLRSSFVLVQFLAYHGFAPLWVFGVKTGPFGAHCWVQLDDAVLNDVPENVNRYTPIMTV